MTAVPTAFQTGDQVTWTSQAAGHAATKVGVVADVVPPGAEPDRARWPQLHRGGIGMPRDHESYVVRVTGRGIYWPRVSALRHHAASGQAGAQGELLAPTSAFVPCTPALLAAGLDCATAPRRPGGPGVGHMHALPGTRAERQRLVHGWCIAAFGDDHARSIEQRALRLAEEAIETAQASGCAAATLHRLIDHIYAKPAGELGQELGGVGVTLLALAAAAGHDAEACEVGEVSRIVCLPLEHFAARNAAKNAAGFNVIPQAEEA